MYRFKHVCFLLLIIPAFFPLTTWSQQDTTRSRRPATRDSTYHFSARESSLREIDGERVFELRGDVTIIHGGVTITSNRGRQFTDRRLTLLTGNVNIDQNELHMEGDTGEYYGFEDKATLSNNVRIRDRGWNVTCDKAIFYRNTDQAWLIGNVVAVDSTTRLTADSVFYDQGPQTVEAFGNVAVYNPDEGVRVIGRHGFFFRQTSEALIDVLPHMIVDPDSEEPTAIDSDMMRFYPDEDRAVAAGKVKILKGNTITQCDSALVVDSERRAELYGNPMARQDNMSMRGDKMVLHYDDEEVNRIGLVGRAMIRETPRDTLIVGRDSWVQGDSMELFFNESRLDSLSVRGEAVSEYYPRSADRVEVNFVRGKRMFFVFEKDSLSTVTVAGEADGVYRFLDLATNETADSLRSLADTSLVYMPFDKHAEKVVYAADSIVYHARERDMMLNNTAKIVYRDRTLLATHIVYNADLQVLDATGTPVLIEGSDKLHGDQMGYDLGTGVGLVKEGSTKFIQGYYRGEDIAKVGDNVLKVWNSQYTTCDRKVPHYHFASNQMKVYLDDKVVTGPIVLFIGETPIAALPFFAANIRQDRRSGILRPDFEFGFTSRSGRFIRDVGYYWATNDYMDFTFVGDFNERSAAQFRIDNQYRLRYHFDGGINYRFLRKLDDYTNEWTIAARHNQTFGNGYRFNGNLSLVSSDAAPREVNNIDEVRDVINRNIRSTAALSKNWEGVIGFSASAVRQQNLNVTGHGAVKVNTTFPDVRLSIPSRTLFFGKRTTVRGQKPFWETVLDGIRYSPGVDFRRTEVEQIIGTSSALVNANMLPTVTTTTLSSNQSLSFSSPIRAGFVNISPSVSARNSYTRTDTRTEQYLDTLVVPGDTTLVPAGQTIDSENVFNWNTGASANTNFFGTFYPNLGFVTGIRHRVSPSVSYNFQPAQNNRPRSQRFTVGLSNSLDLKVRGKDSEQERKLSNVVLWSLSSSYNPDGPSKRQWSTINSRFNTEIYGVGVSVNQSIDPYEWEISSTRITSDLSLNGTHGLGSSGEAAEISRNPLATDTTGLDQDQGTVKDLRDEAEKGDGLPWRVRASLSYSTSKSLDPVSHLNLGGSINLTRSWRVSYNASYNVEARTMQGQDYTLSRDLHCWEMSISRRQLASEWEYYFKVTLKGHPEVYAEQGSRGLGGGQILPGQLGF